MEAPNLDNPLGQEIAVLLRDFLRAIKAVCMYPETNSLPQSLRQSLAGRLIDVVDDYGEIRLSVDKAAILHNGEIIHRDKSREDNLAAIFFSAGITEFAFKPGLTVDSVNRLLSALRAYLTAPTGDGDLGALLWEANLDGFTFQSAQDIALAEYDVNFRIQEYFHREDDKRATDFDTPGNYEAVFLDEQALEDRPPNETVNGYLSPGDLFNVSPEQAAQLNAHEAAEAMGFADLPPVPLPSAHSIVGDERRLTEEEEATVQRLLADDAAFDMYESTSTLLVELLMQETTLKGFSETAIICERIQSEFIAQGQIAAAAFLLQSLQHLARRIKDKKPRWTERLQDIHVTAGSRERLRLLAAALNDHDQLPGADLRLYLDLFDWQALSGLTDLLGELNHRHHRETLCAYLVDHGRGKEEILARGVYDKRWYVVRNSVMILGHIGDERALQHLNQAVTHEDRRVRIELVEALRGKTHPKALALLHRLVFDTDEEIRRESLAALMASSGPSAFEAVALIVQAESFGELDPDDQIALLIAYSRLGKERAVAYLAGLITRFNLLRNPIRTFLRAAAFEALEHNPSEKAAKLLNQFAASWRPDIKRRAAHSLSRRSGKFGGDH